jgi:hypothetical protein
MSGFVGLQSYSPDFGRVYERVQGFQRNALAMRGAEQELDSAERFRNMLPEVVASLGSADPAVRAAALARLGSSSQGFAFAAPLLMGQAGAQQVAALYGAAPPAGAPPQASAAPGAPRDWLETLVAAESGGRADARPVFPPGHPQAGQPRSNAYGPTQFIPSTWRRFAQANPQLFAGMTPDQIMAARSNPGLARQAAAWYARTNAATLRDAGFQVNGQTLALAHQFGAGGAQALLQAPADAPIEAIFPPQPDPRNPGQMRPHPVIAANPDIAGRTVGQVVQQRTARFANARNVPTLEAPPGATATDMPPPGAAFPATPGAAGGVAAAQGVAGAAGVPDALRARPTGRALPPGLERFASPEAQVRLRMMAADPGPAGEPARQILSQLQPFLTQDVELVEVQDPNDPTRTIRVPRDAAFGQQAPIPPNAQAELRREADSLPQVRVFNEVQNAAENFARTFQRSTPESDRNLVEAYARIMAPRQAIGPDGTATIVQDQGALARAQALIQSLTGGRRLEPEIRAQMLAEVQDRYAQARQDAERATQRIARQAQGWNIPLDRVLDLPPPPQFPQGQATPADPQRTPVEAPRAPAGVTPNSVGAMLNRMVRAGELTLDDARRRATAAGIDPSTISGGAQ